MLDELKEEKIVNKVGGRFKLSTLIQKRLVALNRGARPLIEIQTRNPMEIVVQEIIQDKIFLDTSGNVAIRRTEDPTAPCATRGRPSTTCEPLAVCRWKRLEDDGMHQTTPVAMPPRVVRFSAVVHIWKPSHNPVAARNPRRASTRICRTAGFETL